MVSSSGNDEVNFTDMKVCQGKHHTCTPIEMTSGKRRMLA